MRPEGFLGKVDAGYLQALPELRRILRRHEKSVVRADPNGTREPHRGRPAVIVHDAVGGEGPHRAPGGAIHASGHDRVGQEPADSPSAEKRDETVFPVRFHQRGRRLGSLLVDPDLGDPPGRRADEVRRLEPEVSEPARPHRHLQPAVPGAEHGAAARHQRGLPRHRGGHAQGLPGATVSPTRDPELEDVGRRHRGPEDDARHVVLAAEVQHQRVGGAARRARRGPGRVEVPIRDESR